MGFKSDQWANATGEMSGMVAYVRQNTSLRHHNRIEHPYMLMLTLAFRSVGEDGMPTDSLELAAADSAEEAIAGRLESEHEALFGMAVTNDGVRDLFLFLPEEISEDEIEELIRTEAPSFDYDFTQEHDPEWGPYAFISEMIGE